MKKTLSFSQLEAEASAQQQRIPIAPSWKVLDGPEIFKQCPKVSMKFGQFSNSSTSYPIITKNTQIAPLIGASGIEIVIIG